MSNRLEAFSNVTAMIYEAAFNPEIWPQALETLCTLSHSASGSLLILRRDEDPRFTAAGPVIGVLHELADHAEWRNSYSITRIQEAPPPVFTYDADFFSPEMLEGDPLRRPMLRRHGLGGQTATLIPMMSGESVMITFEHSVDDSRPSSQDLTCLNRVRPHLARAAIIATRLRLRAAETAAQSFSDLGFPAAVVDRRGDFLGVSELLQSMPSLLDLLVTKGRGRSDSQVAALVALAVGDSSRGRVVRSVPVLVDAEVGTAVTAVLHILPLRRTSHEIFGSGDALIVVTFPDPSLSAPAAAILSNLFDLTGAEARLASALIKGLSLQEASVACGITQGSARIYLERIFRKTGVNRQGKLVALMKSAQPFRPTV